MVLKYFAFYIIESIIFFFLRVFITINLYVCVPLSLMITLKVFNNLVIYVFFRLGRLLILVLFLNSVHFQYSYTIILLIFSFQQLAKNKSSIVAVTYL